MVSILWFSWIFFSSVIFTLGIWLYLVPNSMPRFLSAVFVYGKLNQERKKFRFVDLIQVPKMWFTHFYAFSVLVDIIYFIIVYQVYINGSPVPEFFCHFLDMLVPNRKITIDSLSAFLVVLFMLLHTGRRLLECLFLSVYSLSTINVLHYILGYWFYFSVAATLASEAPGFSLNYNEQTSFSVKWYHCVGTMLFLYSCYKQNKAHEIFANLRKDNTGKVVTTQHLIPTGDWFEYVSCPHFFAEILIYISLFMVTGFRHHGWWLILLWVASCQIVAALLTHDWYLQKHKDYPAHRKAIIPFLL